MAGHEAAFAAGSIAATVVQAVVMIIATAGAGAGLAVGLVVLKTVIKSAVKTVVKAVERTAARALERAGASGLERSSTGVATYYPPHRGFHNDVSHNETLMPGSRIDRYGADGGHFLSPAGTPIEMRALSPSAEASPLSVFEVVKPFSVRAGQATPYFGRIGLGIQYETGQSVAELLVGGYLRRI